MSFDPIAQGMAAVALAQNSAPYGGRILHFSDSFAQQQVGTTGGSEVYKAPSGGAVWAEMLSLGRLTFDTTNMKGVNGDTTTQMLARMGPDVLARKDLWDICLVDGGRNDAVATKANGDTTIRNLQLMASTINKKNGKLCVVMLPNPPRSLVPDGTTERTVRGYVNQTMRLWCAQNNIPFVDYWRDTADSTSAGGGAWGTGFSDDTLHPNTQSGRIIGQRISDAITPLTPATSYSQPAWDLWDTTLNPKGNAMNQTGATVPFLSGTGGTLAGTGLSGSLAASTFCNCYSGTATCVASKVAATAAAGYGAQSTDKQRFTISAVTVDAGWEFYGGFNVPAGLNGATVVLEFQLEMSSLAGPAKASTFSAAGRGGGAGGNTGEFLGGTWYANEKLLIRTAPHVIGTTGNFYQWALGFFCKATGSGVLDVSNPVIRPQ